ncbi:hypothetical protein TNCV_323231 [Trichonephila clavipes]|nr:hypothetical protein TNCV_323231 [Trichonephila clavipes]
MQVGDDLFPWCLQTLIQSSKYCTQNCATSVSRFVIRLSLRYIVKGIQNNGLRADSPRSCKRCHTVQADAGNAANIPIYRLIVHDRVIRFCRVYFSICLPSLA